MLDEASKPLLLNPTPADKKRTSVVILVAVFFGVVLVFNIPTRNARAPSHIQASFKSASHTCRHLAYYRCTTNDGLTLDAPAEKYFRGFPVAADATIEEYGEPKSVIPVMMASVVDTDSPRLCLPDALNSESGIHSSLVYTDKTVIVVDDECVIHRIIENHAEHVAPESNSGNGNVMVVTDLTLTASLVGVDVVAVTYSGAPGLGSAVIGLYPPRPSWEEDSWYSYTPFWRTVPSASGTMHFGWVPRGVMWVAVLYKAADWNKKPLKVSNEVMTATTTSAPLTYPKGYKESFRSKSSNNVHFYATTIAIDPQGVFMVIGAYDAGQVSVVRGSNDVKTITAPFANGVSARFGYSVATNGRYIVVGAPSYNDNGIVDAGVICVFEKNSTGWVFRKLLKSGAPRQYGELGINVDIDEHNAVVGGEWNRGHNGKAYAWTGISHTALELSRPSNSTEEWSFYGRQVAVRYPIAVVSSERKSYFDIFQYKGGSNFEWKKRVTRETPCCFGSTLTISRDGTTIAAGNYRTVYIFRGNANYVFAEESKIVRTESIGASHFALDLKGHRIAMGYTGDNSRPNGKVFIYDRNTNGEWKMKFQPLSEPPRHFYDYFGLHLAMSDDGTKLVVAAPAASTKSAIMFVTI